MTIIKKDCFYCEKNDVLKSKMTYIMSLDTTIVYLNRDQTNYGRSIVALKNHKDELFELDLDKKSIFIDEVSKSAETIKKITGADKINYAIFGDVVSHLHVHLVPKWKNSSDWDNAFINQPKEIKTINDNDREVFKKQFVEIMKEGSHI